VSSPFPLRLDTIRLYSCDGNQIPPTPSAASPQSYTQEEIHSFILRSPLYGSESVYEGWENDWTRGEVGEGLEEVWERSWATGGKLVSTLRAECLDGYERGEEVGSIHFRSRLEIDELDLDC
jgi:ribonuclease T2